MTVRSRSKRPENGHFQSLDRSQAARDNDRMATVSDEIKKAILAASVTRYRIAQDTGVDEATLSRFVSGERGLSMIAIDLLAEYFGYKLVKSKGK